MFAYWWYQFNRSEIDPWPLETYIIMIPFPVIAYLLCVVLFPHRFDEIEDVEEYFISTRRWFYGLFLASLILDSLEALIIQSADYVLSLGFSIFMITGISMLICVVGSFTRDIRVHGGMAIIMSRFSIGNSSMTIHTWALEYPDVALVNVGR